MEESQWCDAVQTVFADFVPVPDPGPNAKCFEQKTVLLVGLPGAGKSTFAQVVERCLP